MTATTRIKSVQWSDCGIKRGDTASLVALGLELPSATNLFQECGIGEPKQLDVSHTSCECFLHTSLPQLHRLSRTSLCAAVAIESVASIDTTIEPLAAQL
jgi:hypothetical protein